jgi:chromosome segregation ATPase
MVNLLSRWALAIIARLVHSEIHKLEVKIMSKISEFAAAQNAVNDRIDAAVNGLQEDVQGLMAKIEELQNNPGEISPEDQVLLDQIQARGQAIAEKLELLDAINPPPVPQG